MTIFVCVLVYFWNESSNECIQSIALTQNSKQFFLQMNTVHTITKRNLQNKQQLTILTH